MGMGTKQNAWIKKTAQWNYNPIKQHIKDSKGIEKIKVLSSSSQKIFLTNR